MNASSGTMVIKLALTRPFFTPPSLSSLFPSFPLQALGNHEFDNGWEGLVQPFLQDVECPVLSANIRAAASIEPKVAGHYLPYKIFDMGPEKVAVVGYTSRETPALSLPGKKK